MKIAHKIGLMAAVPLVAATGFGATALDSAVTDEVRAQHLGTLIDTVDDSDDLVHQLQVERIATAAFLTRAGVEGVVGPPSGELLSAAAGTDQAILRYRGRRPGLDSLPGTAGDLLSRID